MLRAFLFLWLAIFPAVSPAAPVAATHPFSVHDLLAMDRVSDPRVSPDGKQVVFVLSRTDLEHNRRRTDLWLVGADGGGLRRLTSHEAGDSDPRWSADGRSVWFLSSRSGSSQVCASRPMGAKPSR
jgi:Tol biopolymer transport system component